MNGSTLSPSLAVRPHSKVGKQSTRAVPGPPTKSRLWACAVGSQKLNRLSTFKHQKIILRNIDLGFFFKKLANLTKLSVFAQVHKNMFMCALLFAMVLTLSFLSPPNLLRTFILSTCCLANIWIVHYRLLGGSARMFSKKTELTFLLCCPSLGCMLQLHKINLIAFSLFLSWKQIYNMWIVCSL